MRRPVCRMLESLYGHPDSGTNWEEYADKGIQKAGFEPISKEWQSCYYHPDLKLMLVVYVDDFLTCWSRKEPGRGMEASSQTHLHRARGGIDWTGCDVPGL